MTSRISNLCEVTDRLWDVIVVGAGPAGALAARQTALSGASVLLVERRALSRGKVCGCCLNAAALTTLADVSLGDLTLKLRAIPLERFLLAGRGCQAELALPGGVSLSREALDSALVKEAISCGADFLPDTNAQLGSSKCGFREVVLNHGGHQVTFKTKLVLVADGLGGSFLAKYNGSRSPQQESSRFGAGTVLPKAPRFIRDGTVYMACSKGGYVGLVLLEDGRLDVAAAFDRQFVLATGGLGLAAAKIIAEVGWPKINELTEIPWRGTVALTSYSSRLSCDRVLVLGDAAGYVEPFTGEGISWALASAVAIAPLALQAVQQWDTKLEQEWATCYSRVIKSRQGICRFLARALRHPQLVRATIRLLSFTPKLATPILRRLNAPLSLPRGILV